MPSHHTSLQQSDFHPSIQSEKAHGLKMIFLHEYLAILSKNPALGPESLDSRRSGSSSFTIQTL